jgi:cytochrome c oxidase subunit IV
MATTTTTHHPTQKTYWLVALFLAVVTAIEIAIPYLSAFDSVRAPLLIFFSLVKFITVIAVFMHLRWDLRSYRLYFLFGLIGALAVFMVVLATFRAF